MTTIHDLKKQRDQKYNDLLTACRVFFAFSDEQFHKNKTPLKEGEKYVSMGAGGYFPKSEFDNYINGSKAIKKWFSKAVKECKGARRANIVYELGNYECFYTGDIDEAVDALGKEYTREEVLKVYREELEKETATA